VEENLGAAEIELSEDEIAGTLEAFAALESQKGFG
jgi:hypothetical protein